MSQIKMMPLGGLYEFGNQSYLYRLNDSALLVDAGAFFEDDSPALLNTRFMPDYEQLSKGGQLRGVVITHNHEDHFGGLTFLLNRFPKLPVYCNYFVAANLMMRCQVEGLKIQNLENRIHLVKPEKTIQIDKNFSIEFIPVDHSVPAASMVYITTPEGDILHTGDWRWDRNEDTLNWSRLQKIGKKGLQALVCDSTGIQNTREDLVSETQVTEGLDTVIQQNIDDKTIMIFGTFSTHVQRVAALCELAKKYRRLPVFMGTGMLVNQTVAAGQKMLPLRRIQTDKEMSSSKAFYIVTGTQAETGSTLKRLSQELPLSKPACIVMSASAIPSRRKQIAEMVEGLKANGYRIIQNDAENLTHISGHAPQMDIVRLIETVKPELFIPIHGEERHLKAAEKLALQMNVPEVVRLPQVGTSVSFSRSVYASVKKEFNYQKIIAQKTFNPNFIKRLKEEKTR